MERWSEPQTVLLSREQREELLHLASVEQRSTSSLVREAVARLLAARSGAVA